MNGDFDNKGSGGFDGEGGKEKPWILKPSVTVEEGYNPYRDGESVFEETVKKYPGAFKGAEQLENEEAGAYYYRRRNEWFFSRTAAKRSLGRSSRYIAAILIAYIFLSNFLAVCLRGLFSDAVYDAVVNVSHYFFMAPALIILATVGLKHKTYTFFRKPNTSAFFIFKWSVISLGATYAVAIAGNILFGFLQVFGVKTNDLSQPIPESVGELILYFFTVVVLAPLFEEILFRGIFLTHHLKYGGWHAIIVTGVLFGLIHQNHQQMFFAAALGIIFGYIDVKAGSIIPSLAAHAFVNFYSFAITLCLYFTNHNETLADPSIAFDGPWLAVMLSGALNMLVYLIIVIAVVMLVYEWKKNRSEFELPKGDSFLTEKEKYKAFFADPVMIVLLVILAISIYFISFFNYSVLV